MYISSFSIAGYRSLKQIQIQDMLQVCIFHGLNNSGKSNILSAMETIFRRKLMHEATTFSEIKVVDSVTKTEQVTKQLQRIGAFYQGRITGFRDNFYLNGKDDIAFSVSVTFSSLELEFLKDVLTSLKVPGLKVLTLTGRIRYVDDDTADMILERAVFGKQLLVFEVERGGKMSFFPKLAKLTNEERHNYFERLMDLLADAFALLPSDRYLTSERVAQESPDRLPLTPKTFKQWLFKLSLSRSGHEAFEEIKNMFAGAPFKIGEIGFNKERDEIEIMVKEQNLRLPISRLGSGHQQILYIIANLVLSKKKMMGIEELEINLSPRVQKMLFEKLKQHIYKGSDLVTQIIITSHSDYFEKRKDVRCYEVEHDGDQTIVKPWSKAVRKKFFAPPSPSSGGWAED